MSIGVSLIGVPVKSKSSMSLASGSLAIVSWYLIERACFSAISAVRREPTMRGGSCRCGFRGKSPANREGCRPPFRFDLARRSEMISPE